MFLPFRSLFRRYSSGPEHSPDPPGWKGDEIMSNRLREGGFFQNLPLLMALFSFFIVSGCLPEPQPAAKLGAIRLTVSLAEQEFKSSARIEDVKKIRVNLSRKNDKLTKDAEADFGTGPVDITIGELYPGVWQVLVTALNDSGAVIFQGSGAAVVESGQTAPLSITLFAGPGTLNISCDVSKIPGIAATTAGKLYVYADPTNSSADSYQLLREGDYVKGTVSLAEGTYQIKVAVPQITGALFVSGYYRVDIEAGKTIDLAINADGSITITAVIDTPPPTPQGLTAVYDPAQATVDLTWQEVNVSDLTGYNVYYSNSEGRMIRATDTPLVLPAFRHDIAKVPFYKGRIAYAVSSCDLGGNESLWSEMVYVYQEQEQ